MSLSLKCPFHLGRLIQSRSTENWSFMTHKIFAPSKRVKEIKHKRCCRCIFMPIWNQVLWYAILILSSGKRKNILKNSFKKKKKVPLHFIKFEKLWKLSSYSSLKSPAQSNILSCISMVSNVCFCNKTILTLWNSQLYRSDQLTESFCLSFSTMP